MPIITQTDHNPCVTIVGWKVMIQGHNSVGHMYIPISKNVYDEIEAYKKRNNNVTKVTLIVDFEQ